MSSSCCGSGALSKLAIGLSTGTPTRLDFLDFTPNIVKVYSDGSKRSIRGTLDPNQITVAEGQLHVRFRTTFWITPEIMNVLLPCLGFTNGGSGDSWTQLDAVTDSTVVVGPAGAPEDTYSGVVPSVVEWYGQKGDQPCAMSVEWVGKTWSQASAGTFFISQTNPAMTIGHPFAFNPATGAGNAATVTLGAPYSETLAVPQIRLKLDYGLVVEFNNSTTATNLCSVQRILTFGTSALYSTCDGTPTLYSGPLGGDISGATLAWNLQRSITTNYQTQFSVANAKPVARSYRLIKNDINRMPLLWQCYATSSTPMLTIFNQVAGA